MKITRNGTTPSVPGPADWFTGSVRIEPAFAADGGRRSNGAVVTFEPGARTHWHTHPAGQTILILQGLGWVQREGEPLQQVYAGDVVFFEPKEKHWHGASARIGMAHLAVTEVVNGSAVEWLEAVSDVQYHSPPRRGLPRVEPRAADKRSRGCVSHCRRDEAA